MPQPYDMGSSLQPSAVWSHSSFAFHFRLVQQLIFARTILLLYAVVHSMSHLVIASSTRIQRYWQLLVVKTKDSEVLKVDYTQHNTTYILLARIPPLHILLFSSFARSAV
jgi:hypothetical protein